MRCVKRRAGARGAPCVLLCCVVGMCALLSCKHTGLQTHECTAAAEENTQSSSALDAATPTEGAKISVQLIDSDTGLPIRGVVCLILLEDSPMLDRASMSYVFPAGSKQRQHLDQSGRAVLLVPEYTEFKLIGLDLERRIVLIDEAMSPCAPGEERFFQVKIPMSSDIRRRQRSR